MGFLNRAGNLLKQNVFKRVSSVSSASSPSLFQTISCMSSSAATKLFVGGLSANIDAVSLMEAFSQYGSVIEARVINDSESTTSVGFGFVTYDTIDAASIAIQAFNGQEIQGLKIRVNFATEEPCSGGGYSEGGGYGSGGIYGDGIYGGGGNYGGYRSLGGGYGCGGNQGGGNYSGGDVNYGGDVSNVDGNQFSGGGGGSYGGGNQFSGVGGYNGYGDSVQDGGGGNYSGSKPIGFASLLKYTSGAISDTQVPLGGDQGLD